MLISISYDTDLVSWSVEALMFSWLNIGPDALYPFLVTQIHLLAGHKIVEE